MLQGPVLKHAPSDFLVRENMVVRLTDQATAGQQYLMLRKSGYTTMEAIRLIADKLGLPTRDITYGGLKDEDGITEQLVAVPVGALAALSRDSRGPQEWLLSEPNRWLQLQHYGYGVEPLRIGRLEGNGFQIVVRNLDAEQAARLEQLRKVNLLFLNYYDTQRFGVPGGPKRTHLVGAAILAQEWDLALQELIGLRAPESAMASTWQGPAQEFFARLDPRTSSFYLAAHASGRWNALLLEAVAATCPHEYLCVELEGLAYRYVTSIDAAIKLMGAARELPYERYSYDDGRPVPATSKRSTVVQTTVSMTRHEPDERIPGMFRVGLNLFLPSGCYATAAVRQLLAYARAEGS